MSMNLAQVYALNPITTIGNTDLLYVAQTATTDAGISGSDLKAQIAPLTTKGDIYTFSTVNTRLPVGTVNGQILQVNAATATGLSWSTATYPATTAINEILYSSSANVVAGITTAINGLLVTSNLGVPSILAGPGVANHILMSNAAAAPSWSVPTYPNASVTAGKIIISDGTNYLASTSIWPNTVGAAGKIVISDGTSNVYSTPTYPNASVAAGKIIISDGTNFISSTPTYPNASVGSGKILISDGTNFVASTPTYPNASATLNHFLISDGTNFIASSSALNLAGNFTTVGAFTVSFTFTNNTAVTFPTSGTLTTTADVINFNNVTSSPIVLVNNNGYVVNNGAALVTFQLPVTSAIGDRFIIVGHDSGGWKISQVGVNQHIHVGNLTSTTGLAGFIASTDGNDCVQLICTATNNEFTVISMVGNITVS